MTSATYSNGITDPAEGQSKWPKPENYEEPLPRAFAPEQKGRFIRLSRLWAAAAANPNVKEAQFREITRELFESEGIPGDKIDKLLQPMGELMTTLRDTKLSKVTYLELVPFDKHIWTEDSYNDAIVNIFTRLNTAGRTLTREEITLAWLKVGWDSQATGGMTAGECFQHLLNELADRNLMIGMDDLVGAVSFVWAVCFNGGQLLANRDLLRGSVIRPMASTLARNWAIVRTAILEGVDITNERSLEYGAAGHYTSLNALAVVWSWLFLAHYWEATHKLVEVQKDDFHKKRTATLASHLDRWLICSQWAGRWSVSLSLAVAAYAKNLHEDLLANTKASAHEDVHSVLANRFAVLVRDLETDAITYVNTVNASSRERVYLYRNLLWVWHRLEAQRWKMSQIQLRVGKGRKPVAEVDHSVAFALWERKLTTGMPNGFTDHGEAVAIVNALGNCSLLEKTFNISKSDKTFKSFLEQIHEFKERKNTVVEWAKALALPDDMLDPEGATADTIATCIEERGKVIRADVAKFVRGESPRIDL